MQINQRWGRLAMVSAIVAALSACAAYPQGGYQSGGYQGGYSQGAYSGTGYPGSTQAYPVGNNQVQTYPANNCGYNNPNCYSQQPQQYAQQGRVMNIETVRVQDGSGIGAGGAIAGGVIGGVFMFPVLNFVIGLGTVMLADQGKVLLAFGAVLLALVAFGGGFALWKTGSPVPKGLGLGLMIGWALTSILTVGYCTGLNPTMYT